ncbi:UDP-glucuronate decarboxylase [Salvia divinorum]|uniref:UDP-glucuronate decarboxylase n=1 Tax=Salvia divinorum TaxID=28513 RepID=A0ABD1IL02_SALDI
MGAMYQPTIEKSKVLSGKHENSGYRWGWIHWRSLSYKLMQNEKNEIGHNSVFLDVVIVVDNCFTGSKDNLSQWIGHPRFELIRHEVYGDPLVHPQTEDDWDNVNPIETLMYDYHRQHGIEMLIARIFNTYGPRMNIDDGRVVSNFLAQAIRLPFSRLGAPWMLHVSPDYGAVDGLIRLMEGDHTGPINIGNSGEFTMLELAETVKEMISPNVKITTVENTPDDPRQRKLDITKAQELLGWELKIKLSGGIPLMEEDFR